MRAGGCAVQQALTAEAAGVVKQAVSLARRRGHAQVTPLHVASAMLSAAGLLRAACLQSHSHPLQCKALELCFNVALNRLPTSAVSATAMLGAAHHHHHGHHHHHHLPTLSNALVAAFKRAQAHQRRGSVESQQQPLLAVKIELEQLIISILDDPSVSRVMREAGFSSTQVKANVEKTVSLETNTPMPPNPNPTKPKEATSKPSEQARSVADDAMRVLDCLASRRKRCVVVVGECATTVEGVVRVVMDKVSKGEAHHESLKNLQFIPLSLSSFRRMSREEVEAKAGELRTLVRSSCAFGKGVVVVLEDLNYAAEAWAAASEKRGGDHRTHAHGYYCPVEHVVMEVSSLPCGGGGGAEGSGGERFWMLGFATYPTYMKCRAGHPSLEAVWGLHPLTVPDGGLALSLSCDSETQISQARARMGWSFLGGAAAAESELTCCAECSVKFNAEARSSVSTSTLPPWLRPYQEQDRTRSASCDTNKLRDLCNKWNSICSSSAHRSQHHTPELTLNFSSASSISTYSQCYTNLRHQHYKQPWSLSFEAKQPWQADHRYDDPRVELHENVHGQQQSASMQSANPNPNSASSSDGTTEVFDHRPRFKELNAENLKVLCNALERPVAWQKDIATGIASVVLQCRSGMRRRRVKPSTSLSSSGGAKEETWLLFQGGDSDGKERIARELASLVFGSCNNFVSIALCAFASTRSDSSDELIHHKRQRTGNAHGHVQRLYQAICENPHRVVMIEDIEQLDYDSQFGIKSAIESGTIKGYNGDEVALDDAIVVLSCEVFDSRSRACSPRVKQKVDTDIDDDEKEIGSCFRLDLNACAAEDHEGQEDMSLDDVVDGVFFFRLPEDL